jgi:hypothetical protein
MGTMAVSPSHRLLESMCRRHRSMWRRSHGSMLHRAGVTAVVGVVLAGATADGGMVDGGPLTGNASLFGGLPNYPDERPRGLSLPPLS